MKKCGNCIHYNKSDSRCQRYTNVTVDASSGRGCKYYVLREDEVCGMCMHNQGGNCRARSIMVCDDYKVAGCESYHKVKKCCNNCKHYKDKYCTLNDGSVLMLPVFAHCHHFSARPSIIEIKLCNNCARLNDKHCTLHDMAIAYIKLTTCGSFIAKCNERCTNCQYLDDDKCKLSGDSVTDAEIWTCGGHKVKALDTRTTCSACIHFSDNVCLVSKRSVYGDYTACSMHFKATPLSTRSCGKCAYFKAGMCEVVPTDFRVVSAYDGVECRDYIATNRTCAVCANYQEVICEKFKDAGIICVSYAIRRDKLCTDCGRLSGDMCTLYGNLLHYANASTCHHFIARAGSTQCCGTCVHFGQYNYCHVVKEFLGPSSGSDCTKYTKKGGGVQSAKSTRQSCEPCRYRDDDMCTTFHRKVRYGVRFLLSCAYYEFDRLTASCETCGHLCKTAGKLSEICTNWTSTPFFPAIPSKTCHTCRFHKTGIWCYLQVTNIPYYEDRTSACCSDYKVDWEEVLVLDYTCKSCWYNKGQGICTANPSRAITEYSTWRVGCSDYRFK